MKRVAREDVIAVSTSHDQASRNAETLVRLLDYVEQVVRLDERIAFRLADYRLADGTNFALRGTEVVGLPGIGLDLREDDEPVWLRIERLNREPPPTPPDALLPWICIDPDPDKPPVIRSERRETVSAELRNALLAAGEAAEEDFDPVPESADAAASPRFDRRLDITPPERAAAEDWVAGPWRFWSEAERPRRGSIAIYGALYKLQQQLEVGGADSAVEAIWGIGPVLWSVEGRTVDRPLLECAVELDLGQDGTIRIRPRATSTRFDLKPYEEISCPNLGLLDEVLRREIERTAEDEGMTPFRPETYSPALSAAAARLTPDGRYLPMAPAADLAGEGLTVTGDWVLFARPRSRHVVLDDIGRLRDLALRAPALHGLAERLVTPPSASNALTWQPLGDRLGTATGGSEDPGEAPVIADVFFPKPFNEEQIAIARRLAKGDGLVVQGPPGTGKTHTIANLMCHAMAVGQRVLVVSRGEAALAVLRDQLPEKVRPLAISILSSERAGLRQVETAIREIQSVVEESRPEIRLSAIRRCEAEILKVQGRVAAIDAELDAVAERQMAPVGPHRVAPVELARGLGAARMRHGWFVDRPDCFAAESGLEDTDMAALREARRALRGDIDHADAVLPALAVLPDAETVAGWHEDLCRASELDGAARAGPAQGLRLNGQQVGSAEACARALRELAATWGETAPHPWLQAPLAACAGHGSSPWLPLLQDIAQDARASEAERIRLAAFAIELPERLSRDAEGRAAIERAAGGGRLWSLLAIGRSLSKDLVAEVSVRGRPPGEDARLWGAVADALRLKDRRYEIEARWRTFAGEAGASRPGEPDSLAMATRFLAAVDALRAPLAALGDAARKLPALAAVATDGTLAHALADQLDDAVTMARLAAADGARAATTALFVGDDRTLRMARSFLDEVVGRADVAAEKVGALWSGILDRLSVLSTLDDSFAALRAVAENIAAAGAPQWAARLRSEPSDDAVDPLVPSDWREAWDFGAAEAQLARIDGQGRLGALSREREAAHRRLAKLFVELVRERAFLALERRLSPRVKSALVEYVRAIGRLGKGTGKGAGRHRRVAREAMERCYDAIPCWILPTWRVAEQLPADLAAFDLVILDEASQSDVTELPALLRGKVVLAVGDDRQVSPTPPFVTQARIEQLRHHYLRRLPYASLLEPGESLYDLLRAVYPDSRLMLKEHFRCVEPIIRFSMQFYPEKLLPLRVPSPAERLDPPLVDIFVPHGLRDGARKINRAEAEVIVEEIAGLVADGRGAGRTIGVISLIGGEQAELVRVMLAERIGEEAMQRHKVLCGDSATFQGNERDIVFLSMVADRKRRSTLTMLRYEQRFNVAVSRARDRLVLVRSVAPEDLKARDLKARLIAHFDNPMPARPALADPSSLCESEFERDLLRRLVGLGYRVTPQVGAEGFRIDLVAEGVDGQRLAIECDGDSFHGPEQWREDMRRQRILERVGWRFWRCFASNYYRDPDGAVADLVTALAEAGVEPIGHAEMANASRLVERRVAAAPPGPEDEALPDPAPAAPLRSGDRVSLLFADRRRLTIRLTEDRTDEARGMVARTTPLGQALLEAEEGEELDLPFAAGRLRATVEALDRDR